jgi:hypothetical protein
MAWQVDEPAGATDFLVSVGYIRDNNSAIEDVLGATRLSNGTEIPELFPLYGATPMLFYMSSPPTGWTEVADIGDTLVAVKGGTTYTTGDSSKGSWALPGHTLVSAEMPAHTHTYLKANVTASRRTNGNLVVTGVTALANTEERFSPSPHYHGSTWRPAGRVCIMATKD